MAKHLVFVYGTLRQGGVRAMTDIFPDSKFIGREAFYIAAMATVA